jgi:hypothetical protein
MVLEFLLTSKLPVTLGGGQAEKCGRTAMLDHVPEAQFGLLLERNKTRPSLRFPQELDRENPHS